ncbi:MAG: RNA polymerase factor sigma-54 [Bacteroidota bacterium]|nr:RNA polymerase factor sigma-54 [Bacteroidota bacterium]
MLKQSLNQKLQQKLSPQQIQFVQLLQLNTTEIINKVDEEIAENAALDKNEDDSDNKEDKNEENNSEDSSSEEDNLEAELSDYMNDEDNFQLYTPNYNQQEERKEIPIADFKTLYDNLIEQLNTMELTERQKELANHLIGMIEEDGYLRRPLKSIAYDLAFINNITTNEEELATVLKEIQTIDPPGIGARNLEECLLIQLEAKEKEEGESENIDLAKTIISSHIKLLANKHYEKLMKNVGITKDKLKEIINVITHLNPKPGESQINVKTQYITPDFLVNQLSNGEFEISLNSHNTPHLKINRGFKEKLESYKAQKKENKKLKDELQFIKQKLDNAKWFIEAIKQRQQTLLMTMSTIVDLQKPFFKTGDYTKLTPMILKDIAEKIEMDISTVSRVVSSKYAQTDNGIIPLRDCFSEGIMTTSGVEVSNKEVKRILKEMIENESKKKPLTDEKLTTMLNKKGYNIARRTVAKYREQMKIPVARLRKEL